MPLHYFGVDLVAFRRSGRRGQCAQRPLPTSRGQPVQRWLRRRGRHPMPVPRLGVERRGPQRADPVREAAQSRPQGAVVAGDRSSTTRSTSGTTRPAALRCGRCPTGSRVLGDHIYVPGLRIRSDEECAHQVPENVHVHPQVIAENAVDPHHFRFVHKTPVSPTVLREDADDDRRGRPRSVSVKRWSDGIDRAGGNHEHHRRSTGRASAFRSTASTPATGFAGHRICADPGRRYETQTSSPRYWIDEAQRQLRGTSDGCAGGVAGRHRDLGTPDLHGSAGSDAVRSRRLQAVAHVGAQLLSRVGRAALRRMPSPAVAT